MISKRHNISGVMTMALALACGALAVLWPQWRADLGAASYYGYGVAAPQTVPTAQLGEPYFQVVTLGGVTPDSVSVVSGSLPFGITLTIGSPPASPAKSMSNVRTSGQGVRAVTPSLILSGTPTQTGTFLFTALVVNNTQGSILGRIKMTVCPNVSTLSFCETALLEATHNVPFSDFITPKAGTPPYIFGLFVKAPSALPPGLTLNANGTITGTPLDSAKSKKFTVQVTDSVGGLFSGPLSLTVLKNIKITGGLKKAKVGAAYSAALKATGGLAPIVWSAQGLPSGLTLDSFLGVVSGVPQVAGKFPVALEASDALMGTASKTVNLTVRP
jgi:hypothetical protein